MSDSTPEPTARAAKAEHGARSELSWDNGQGRQPYGNRDAAPGRGPAAAPQAPQGNRGAASGRNLKQLEQVRRKP